MSARPLLTLALAAALSLPVASATAAPPPTTGVAPVTRGVTRAAAQTTAPTAATQRPASTRQLSVPAVAPSRAGRAAGRTTALSEPSTRSFGMVGVTWAKGTGTGTVRVEVRTRSRGHWSAWSSLARDEDGDGATREGTEPMWVGSADGVGARVTYVGRVAPRAIRVVVVDPGTGSAVAAPTTSATSNARIATATRYGDGTPTYTAQPAMITRARWGARRNTTCDAPVYGARTLGVVLHHTVNSNSYTRAQSAGIVRSIQAFHMDGRGWCDIGYDFLVDKYGQIFQGRNGDVRRQVRGAHAGNFTVNTYDMGVAMIGNFDTAVPSAALKRAVVKLIGWRLGTNFLTARGRYAIAGHTLNRISGHRDIYLSGIRPATSTACPGRYGYAWLTSSTGLRVRVGSYISHYSTPIKTRAHRLGTAVTGYVEMGEYPTVVGGHRAIFRYGEMLYNKPTGVHFVAGVVSAEYDHWTAQAGALGWPTQDFYGSDVSKPGFQRFQHGSIYRVPLANGTRAAYALTAGVDTEYRSLSMYAGKLGTPTSRVTTSNGIDTATFQHGRISYNESTGVATVTYS